MCKRRTHASAGAGRTPRADNRGLYDTRRPPATETPGATTTAMAGKLPTNTQPAGRVVAVAGRVTRRACAAEIARFPSLHASFCQSFVCRSICQSAFF